MRPMSFSFPTTFQTSLTFSAEFKFNKNKIKIQKNFFSKRINNGDIIFKMGNVVAKTG